MRKGSKGRKYEKLIRRKTNYEKEGQMKQLKDPNHLHKCFVMLRLSVCLGEFSNSHSSQPCAYTLVYAQIALG